ncbi:MAG: hypothetical protein JWL77_4981 [Chthonomonadaceae bacterium]|nr:hypothetical protein [Chthonomonadaceae bacterium]
MRRPETPASISKSLPARLSPGLLAGICMAVVWIGGYGLFRWLAPNSMSAAAPTQQTAAHAHQSLHGGLVQTVGDNHVEALFDTGGEVRVFILGQDETQMAPISAPTLQAEVLPQNARQVTPLTLQAAPQYGEMVGHASLFKGLLPANLRSQPLAILLTVPLNGKLYRVRLEPDLHATEPAMPNNPADRSPEEERKLFLTPGGKYTQADILANGNTVPSVKYADFVAAHNMHPQKGEPICPITNTAANPKLFWIVGGKSYTFCCPPCLREFVAKAKTRPASIHSPEYYIQH